MRWMDVDIALASVPVNILPLIDDTDFKTIEAALTYDQAGLALFWNFTTTAGVTTVTAVTPTTSGVYDWTDFTTSGMYGLEMPASGGGTINNDAEGIGHFTGVATGVLPWRGPEIGFRAAALNNTFIDDASSILTGADVGLLYESVITTSTTETELIMALAFPVDDTWIGCEVSLEDKSANQFYSGNIWISDAVQSTETLHLNTAFPVAIEDGVDVLRIYARQHAGFAVAAKATSVEVAAVTSAVLADAISTARALARSDAANSADESAKITEINADGGSGAGDYSSTDDSQEGVRDGVIALQTSINTVDTVVDGIQTDLSNATDGLGAIKTDTAAVKVVTDKFNFGVTNVVDANLTNVAGGGDLQTDGSGNQKIGT